MANFDSGVKGYIHGTCLVDVYFPVDNKDRADVCCDQCDYYHRSLKQCELNKTLVNYPSTHIGRKCPLTFDGEVDDE